MATEKCRTLGKERPITLWVYTSACTVGLPRESKIWRPTTLVMAEGVSFFRHSACSNDRGSDLFH